MFEEQEQKLLSLHLARARRDYKNHSNVYPISAFDENFDQQLQKLVIFYGFDFEAIALHLYFKFPQYAFRMKPQAVQYRWYQLTLQRQGERIRQQLQRVVPKQEKSQQLIAEEKAQMAQQQSQQIVLVDLKEKREHYEAAMRMAAFLDEQQEEGFMVYRPKFIVDSQFKLERERSEDTLILSAILDNGVGFQFGAFAPPQAAPLNIPLPNIAEIQAAAPEIAAQQQQYLDDDWQAYESD